MEEFKLLKSQKNHLFEIIKNLQLEVFNFKWKQRMINDVIELQAPCLEYEGTDYFYAIGYLQNRFFCMYSPGQETIFEQDNPFNWDDLTYNFVKWLNNLQREIEQPDLWSEIERYHIFAESTHESDYGQFSYSEVQKIEAGINEIRGYISNNIELSNNQLELANEKLDYLICASKRMDRIDWKNIFVGALVSLSITLSLTPEQGEVVIELFKKAVSGIVKLIGS